MLLYHWYYNAYKGEYNGRVNNNFYLDTPTRYISAAGKTESWGTDIHPQNDLDWRSDLQYQEHYGKSWWVYMYIYIAFIDYKRAFDTVWHSILWAVLKKGGIGSQSSIHYYMQIRIGCDIWRNTLPYARLWKTHAIRKSINLKLLVTLVLSDELYDCETWSMRGISKLMLSGQHVTSRKCISSRRTSKEKSYVLEEDGLGK